MIMTGCQFVDVVSACAWVAFFVAFSAHRNCALVYYGFHWVRSMFRAGIPSDLLGIRFWCFVHAVLDFTYSQMQVTRKPRSGASLGFLTRDDRAASLPVS